MNVTVTGGTGFIGRRLVAALRARRDVVHVLAREPLRARALLGEDVEATRWDADTASGEWEAAIATADAVVHLAGEPVMARRWTPAFKAKILESRVNGTRHVVESILRAAHKPKVLVCSSGVDFYGDTGERLADETSPAGSTFLSEVCRAWEREAQRVSEAGVREVRLRTGLVLGEAGGALASMVTPFRLFVGGPVGGRKQWVSWIQDEDMVRVILAAIDDERLKGPVNAVAPEPVRMAEFARQLGATLHRPSWAPVPRFALRALVGEAGGLIAESKRARPLALERVGFQFRHPALAEALQSAFSTAV